MAIMKQTNP